MSRNHSRFVLASVSGVSVLCLGTAAHAVAPTLPNATGAADASACFESPCDGGVWVGLKDAASTGLRSQQPSRAAVGGRICEMLANVVGGPTFTATASVDPFLIIPPGYQLELSPGILNGIAPIPEPSTWALMLVGFAGLGFVGCRGRRKAIAA
jgi:hypothetical protein